MCFPLFSVLLCLLFHPHRFLHPQVVVSALQEAQSGHEEKKLLEGRVHVAEERIQHLKNGAGGDFFLLSLAVMC